MQNTDNNTSEGFSPPLEIENEVTTEIDYPIDSPIQNADTASVGLDWNDDYIQFKERVFTKFESLKEDNQQLNRKCDEFYKNNCNLRKEINDLSLECDNLVRQNRDIVENYLKIQDITTKLMEQSNNLKKQNREKTQAIADLKKKQTDLSTELELLYSILENEHGIDLLKIKIQNNSTN